MKRRTRIFKSKDLMRILKQMGFYEVRRKGAHICFKHPDGRFTLIPCHSREDIGRGLLRQILREIGLSPEEFSRYI